MKHNEVEQIIKPIVEDMGYVIWGCEYLSQGKHSLLRIYIDHDDGIGIEDCQRVSREISSVLDVEDPIPGQYSLEVSSPGIPRPLFHPWQYQLFVDQIIKIKVFKPIDGKRTFSGTIVSVDEDKLTLKVDDDELEIFISNIVKAYLTV